MNRLAGIQFSPIKLLKIMKHGQDSQNKKKEGKNHNRQGGIADPYAAGPFKRKKLSAAGAFRNPPGLLFPGLGIILSVPASFANKFHSDFFHRESESRVGLRLNFGWQEYRP